MKARHISLPADSWNDHHHARVGVLKIEEQHDAPVPCAFPWTKRCSRRYDTSAPSSSTRRPMALEATRPQMKDFVDKQAEYAKLVDQVAEEQAKENAARAKDETELKQAEDNLHKTELEIQKAEI